MEASKKIYIKVILKRKVLVFLKYCSNDCGTWISAYQICFNCYITVQEKIMRKVWRYKRSNQKL